MGSGGGAPAGRLHVQDNGPRMAAHWAQLHAGVVSRSSITPTGSVAAQIRTASTTRTAQEGRDVVRRPVLPLPAMRGAGAATGSPGDALPAIRARAVPSNRGTAAVPLLDDSVPRTTAPRMAAHRAQLHAGAGALPAHPGRGTGSAAQICAANTSRTGQEGQEAGRQLLPCLCTSCPTQGQERPQEAQGAPSHHPGRRAAQEGRDVVRRPVLPLPAMRGAGAAQDSPETAPGGPGCTLSTIQALRIALKAHRRSQIYPLAVRGDRKL